LDISLGYGAIVIAILAVIIIAKTAIVVPQQSAFVVQYLGKYSRTLNAGFHILVPFAEAVAYRHSLKEIAVDIPEQICITRDNVQVGVDAVLYMQVLDPHLASYGITNYGFAISQLAQTTLRSEIGKIELDRTFEARGVINANVVGELDKASVAWGVKVLRYEIKNITPPKDVLSAMEKQMRAEREKRAVVLTSEGERDAKINSAEGDKQRVIKQSEATKQQQINEAEGQAQAILAVATATAEGLRQVGIALSDRGGIEAMQLRIGEEYVKQFGKLAQSGTTLVVPANLSDLASIVTMATSIAAGAVTDLNPAMGPPRRGPSRSPVFFAGNGAVADVPAILDQVPMNGVDQIVGLRSCRAHGGPHSHRAQHPAAVGEQL
jgi:regulator of protease activity HflC (stomatin/prohibitin superfamily)